MGNDTYLLLLYAISSILSRWLKNLIYRHCVHVTSEKVIPRWEQDYQLQPSSKLGLFYEYLEMGEMAIHYWHFVCYICSCCC